MIRHHGAVRTVAVVILLMAGLGAVALHLRGSSSGPVGRPVGSLAVVPAPVPAGTNRRLAAVRVAHAIAHFPAPPGAKPRATAPSARLTRFASYNGALDPTLDRTRWWIVPLRYHDAVAWYLSHVHAIDGDPDPTGPIPTLSWDVGTPTQSSSPLFEYVEFERLSPHSTALRADADVAYRYDRTSQSLAPDSVSSVEITDSRDADGTQVKGRVTIADRHVEARLVTAFDASPTNYTGGMCDMKLPVADYYSLTFRWPGHALSVDTGLATCVPGRVLTLDGHVLPTTLQDDAALDEAIQDGYAPS